MADSDLSKITIAAQKTQAKAHEDAKKAYEDFRLFLLAQHERILAERDSECEKNERLREENKDMFGQVERLKARADFSIFGDGLLTVGCFGLSFLGVCGREMLPIDYFYDGIISAVMLVLIGLICKFFIWYSKR